MGILTFLVVPDNLLAVIYKCVDENGNVTFTSQEKPGCELFGGSNESEHPGNSVATKSHDESNDPDRYLEEVQNRIKSNWIFPSSLDCQSHQKDLSVTVLVRVKQDGSIVKACFAERSSNSKYDASVMEAVERSNPFPPTPERFNTQIEMEIKCQLSEMNEGR